MSVSLLAAGAAAGAAGGLGGGLMKKGDTTVTPQYAEEQKPFLAAAQMQIPLYMQLISGQMPDYLKRYLAQTQGQLARQTRGGIQEYRRQIGMRGGGQFGPAAMAQMGRMYQQMPQIAAGALGQQRAGLMGQALQQMGRWSEITPQGTKTKTEQPSLGRMAAGGALQGISGAMGQRMGPTGAKPAPTPARAAAPPYREAEPTPGGRTAARQWMRRQTADVTGLGRYLPGGIPGL